MSLFIQYLIHTSIRFTTGIRLMGKKMVIASFSMVVATVTFSGCAGLLFPRVMNFENWGIVYFHPSFLGKKFWTKFLWSCGGLDFSWDGWHEDLVSNVARCLWCHRQFLKRGVEWGWLSYFKQGEEKPHSSAKQRPAKRVSCRNLLNVADVALFWRDRSLQLLPPNPIYKALFLGRTQGLSEGW